MPLKNISKIAYKCEESYAGNIIKLTENAPAAAIREINISGLDPKNTFIINADKESKCRFLKCSDRKFCDYIIITIKNNKTHIIYIELKSNTYKNNEIEQKFKEVEQFMKYVATIHDTNHAAFQILAADKKFLLIHKAKPGHKRNSRNQSYGKNFAFKKIPANNGQNLPANLLLN